MYNQRTDEEKLRIEREVVDALAEQGLSVDEDPISKQATWRIIATAIAYLLGATQKDTTKYGPRRGQDSHDYLYVTTGEIIDLVFEPVGELASPDGQMAVDVDGFVSGRVYTPWSVTARRAAQLHIVVDVMMQRYPQWTDADRADELRANLEALHSKHDGVA